MSSTPLTNPEQPDDALAGKLKRTELRYSASSIPGREIVQVLTEISAGVESGWHIHPGEEVGYILAGGEVVPLLDALGIPRAIVAGYDWSGRAACVAAALWRDRCAGIVSVNSYLIQDIASAMTPIRPDLEAGFWYFYYFLTERGRVGLPPTGATSPRSSGRGTRPTGTSMWRRWTGPRWPLTIPTTSRSYSIPTGPEQERKE
jgi:pimeloyl-ACP methyl ester carboxylesterase